MSVCSDWSRQTGIWSPPLATSPWSSGSELVARRTKSLRNRSSTFGLNTLTTPPRRPLRTAFVCLFLYGSPRRWINICISFRKQFIILFVGLHAQLCHCEQWSWGKVLDHRESLLVMHQIQAMQAGKICFDLYFQPLITNWQKNWPLERDKISDVGANISFFFFSPFINFFLASHMGTDSLGYQDDDHSEKVCTLSFIWYLCGDAINFQRSAALNCVWSKRCVPSLSLL